MEILTQFWINIENTIHYLITLLFTYVHATIDTVELIIQQWVIVNEDYEQEENNNNRKIGFK